MLASVNYRCVIVQAATFNLVLDILAAGCMTHQVAEVSQDFWQPQLGYPGCDFGQDGECAGLEAAAGVWTPGKCCIGEALARSPPTL